MKKTSLLTLLLFAAIQFSTIAQDSTKHLEALLPLVGHWEGSGWMRMQDGNQIEFNQTEDIYTKLEGKLLVVNGLGIDKANNKKIFEAFGIISYSAEQEKYVFNAYKLEGQHIVADVALSDGQFDWWFSLPNGGTIKYSIKYTDSTWSEDGNYSPDGEKWYPFFHMDLTKKDTE